MKKKVIAYCHTHWDREWYREFEVFRTRLLRVFDNILDMLETDKLPSFYFDGHTCALEDYLAIRPEKTELVKSLIKDRRLFIGPFYCLIDEFLTDENVFRKNIERGLEFAKEFGCSDFVGYFSDTFGHTANVIPILKEYGIDTALVWRGCGDIPSEFQWEVNEGIDKSITSYLDETNAKCKINCINLIRGYFNDYFSAPLSIEKKVECIKENLDKLAEKSGDVILLPIGGDHLGVPSDLMDTVDKVNALLDDYEIVVGSIFDYIELVRGNFNQFEHIGELRDNSKTFILPGSYSSRLDLKKLNIETSYKLDLADKYRKYFKETSAKYNNLIKYAYELLVKNQAHDSIYGCSVDDVHREDVIRYKKIQQISNAIIDELKFENNISDTEVINVGNLVYTGAVEFDSTEKLEGYQVLSTKKGFDKKLLNDTLKVPITEDWTDIYTYLGYINSIEGNSRSTVFTFTPSEGDVFVTDKCIGNSKIFLSIENEQIKIGDYELKFVDYIDNGDSYNEGPVVNDGLDDKGVEGKILSSKLLYNGLIRSALQIKVDVGDILNIIVELDNQSEALNFKIDWTNTKKNHNIRAVLVTKSPITETYSEDMNKIIGREFNSDYRLRDNLPQTKGVEAPTNTAPMQRGIWANGVGIVTSGLTQYEVIGEELYISILRATGLISNPQNSSRTTPAGPPIELKDLQQLGENTAEFAIFIGDKDRLKKNIDNKFKLIV